MKSKNGQSVYHNITFETGIVISEYYTGSLIERALKKDTGNILVCGVWWDSQKFNHVKSNELSLIEVEQGKEWYE